MVRIRLKRMGRRNRPFFRINAIEKRTKRDGKIIEKLGWYDPIEKNPEKAMKLDIERIKYWLSVGAQPSEKVQALLNRHGVKKPAPGEPWALPEPPAAAPASTAPAPAPASPPPTS